MVACSFCHENVNEYIDGRTTSGSWADMCLACFRVYGIGLGTGKGQHYKNGKKVIVKEGTPEGRKAKVTLARVMQAIEEDDSLGFCLACGEQAYQVEPDARGYECEECGQKRVYGAEELLTMISV